MRSSDGSVACRFSYDSYGKVRVHLPGDFNGDGAVDENDASAFDDAYSHTGGALPSADWDGDGVVDTKDQDAFYKDYSNAEGVATFGPETFGPCVLRIGYCGYVHDSNFTLRWLARNRWYDSDLGRFISRDPGGYSDGLSMYLYVHGNPFSLVDPTGLEPEDIDIGPKPGEDDVSPGNVAGWIGNGLLNAGKGLLNSLKPHWPNWRRPPLIADVVDMFAVGPYRVGNGLYTAGSGNKTDDRGIPTGETATPKERWEIGAENTLNTALILAPAAKVVASKIGAGTTPPAETGAPKVSGETTAPRTTPGVNATEPKTAAEPAPAAGLTRDANGRLRNPDGTFAKDPNAPAKPANDPSKEHGNTLNDEPAWLYRMFDKDNNFLKWGITNDLDGRYSPQELNGGKLFPFDNGPRRTMGEIERALVEREPGPKNKEPWAGKKKGKQD